MEDVTDDIFADLVGGMKQIHAHVRGEDSGLKLHIPKTLDVAAIRERSGKSQPAFASGIGVNVSTLKQWEQGRRSPQGPARVLLAMINAEPDVVVRVLSLNPKTKRQEGSKPVGKAPPKKGRSRVAAAS